MENVKQQLIDEIKKQMEAIIEEIKIWEARVKVEQKMITMRDLPAEIAEDTKYSIIGLESMLFSEQNKNAELKKSLKTLEYREKLIDKFKDGDL